MGPECQAIIRFSRKKKAFLVAFFAELSQATIQNIGADKYAQLIITVPPIDEQASILEYLDAKCSVIDGIIEEKQKQSERMKQQKMSMIYELVTGKKRVKGVQQDAH